MLNNLFRKEVSLPEDKSPHSRVNIEWWYFFAYLTVDQAKQYALMASFFRVGEFPCSKGHYLIYTLIDLEQITRHNYSLLDAKLKRIILTQYLPIYLILHSRDTAMWNLFKSLLKSQIPAPHMLFAKTEIQQNPAKLVFGENTLTFFDNKEDFFKVRLAEKNWKLDLQFTPTKPVALIGGDGKPNNLYYYSMTRNQVTGELQTEKGSALVNGQGWFDHQWGIDYGLINGSGWNWFGLQLDDGRELLLNEERSKTGKTFSPMANLIEADGSLKYSREVTFEPIEFWESPQTTVRYPIIWEIVIPAFSIELKVTATFPEQEMFIIGPLQAIWEGACILSGRETLPAGRINNLTGKGFVELVGYAFSEKKEKSRLLRGEG